MKVFVWILFIVANNLLAASSPFVPIVKGMKSSKEVKAPPIFLPRVKKKFISSTSLSVYKDSFSYDSKNDRFNKSFRSEGSDLPVLIKVSQQFSSQNQVGESGIGMSVMIGRNAGVGRYKDGRIESRKTVLWTGFFDLARTGVGG